MFFWIFAEGSGQKVPAVPIREADNRDEDRCPALTKIGVGRPAGFVGGIQRAAAL
jgi:hypothetical protein